MRWWIEFLDFAEEIGRVALPAAASTVELFIARLDLQGRGGGARMAAAAVASFHVRAGFENPCAAGRSRLVLEGAERVWSQQARRLRRDPFPMEALRAWVNGPEFRRSSFVAVRDACLVALGLRTMRRSSELAALRLEDLPYVGRGSGAAERVVILIRRAKNDQLARGLEIFVDGVADSPTCPVLLLRRWLTMRGAEPGLLFFSVDGRSLSSSAISSICRRMVGAAGRSEWVSSHSLRIGGATAAVEGGLTREQTMTIGGWHSNAVDRYLRTRETASRGASSRMGF